MWYSLILAVSNGEIMPLTCLFWDMQYQGQGLHYRKMVFGTIQGLLACCTLLLLGQHRRDDVHTAVSGQQLLRPQSSDGCPCMQSPHLLMQPKNNPLVPTARPSSGRTKQSPKTMLQSPQSIAWPAAAAMGWAVARAPPATMAA